MGHYDDLIALEEKETTARLAKARDMSVDEYLQWVKDIKQFNRGKAIYQRKLQEEEDLDFFHKNRFTKRMQLDYIKE